MTELLDREKYISAGVHLGMRDKTEQMDQFIFKTRPDGLSIVDVKKIDERISVAASFLSQYDKIMVAGRKDNTKEPVRMFGEAIDIKSVDGRFMPGTLTNPSLPGYYEPKILIVADPLVDKQAVEEAVKKKIPVIAICDTFNNLDLIDLVIPGNNKGKKSVGTIFYLLAREILKNKGEIDSDEEFDYELSDFASEEE